MRTNNNEELLAAANPIPNITQLESEAFSIDDVVDRIDAAIEPSRPAATRPRIGRTLAAVGMALVVLVAVGAAGILVLQGEDSPAGGSCADSYAPTTAPGDSSGSATHNPFIGIHQSLVSASDVPVFMARITGAPPGEPVYFRLATLDAFDGGHFYASSEAGESPATSSWIDDCNAWLGPLTPITVDVTIERLRLDWLPAPATPNALRSSVIASDEIRVRLADAAIALTDDITYEGMKYSVNVDLPRIDLASLVAGSDDELSGVFAAAKAAGEVVPTPAPLVVHDGPRDHAGHTRLPGDAGLRLDELTALAASITEGSVTDFERALRLEAWFHSDAFATTVDIESDVDGSELAKWLLDPESRTFHIGYTEHFASAMAVLARTLDIPSRVVLGFTPGEPDPDREDLVVVRDRNAHAWVELWIPQHGWMRFDPTPRPDGINVPMFEIVGDQLGFDLLPYLR